MSKYLTPTTKTQFGSSNFQSAPSERRQVIFSPLCTLHTILSRPSLFYTVFILVKTCFVFLWAKYSAKILSYFDVWVVFETKTFMIYTFCPV
jgi:hypothetical protein